MESLFVHLIPHESSDAGRAQGEVCSAKCRLSIRGPGAGIGNGPWITGCRLRSASTLSSLLRMRQERGLCLDTQVGRRAFIHICAGAGLVSIGGVIGATFVKSPEQLRAETAPPERSLLTAPVEKRILASTV